MEETSLFSVAVRDAMTKAGFRSAGASVSEAITEVREKPRGMLLTACPTWLVLSKLAYIAQTCLPRGRCSL